MPIGFINKVTRVHKATTAAYDTSLCSAILVVFRPVNRASQVHINSPLFLDTVPLVDLDLLVQRRTF